MLSSRRWSSASDGTTNVGLKYRMEFAHRALPDIHDKLEILGNNGRSITRVISEVATQFSIPNRSMSAGVATAGRDFACARSANRRPTGPALAPRSRSGRLEPASQSRLLGSMAHSPRFRLARE